MFNNVYFTEEARTKCSIMLVIERTETDSLPSLREQGAGSRHHEDQTIKRKKFFIFLFCQCEILRNKSNLYNHLYLQHSNHHNLNWSMEISDSL